VDGISGIGRMDTDRVEGYKPLQVGFIKATGKMICLRAKAYSTLPTGLHWQGYFREGS
jgi:hypothetical protein